MYLNLFMIDIIKNNLKSLGAKLWGHIPLPLGQLVLHAVTVHFFSRDFRKEQKID
ncbi:Phage protein [Lactococcus lactis subsp. lactis]|nr:Phage protein [Lactococcus lactis subsp. lactis]